MRELLCGIIIVIIIIN